MKKGNVLAVLLATVGIMLFGTLAVSADAHAGIQSASGKSSVPTAIAENESGAVTSAKASVGKSRKAKASVNAVADSGLYQWKRAGDICPSAGSRAMDLINQYRKANGKSRIVQDNTYERMAITRAGEISVYYNAMRPSGIAGPDCIIGFYDEDKGQTIDSWFNKLNPDLKKLLLDDQWKSGWVGVFRNEAGYCYVAVDFYTTAAQGSMNSNYSEGEYTLTLHVMDKCLNVKGLLCDKNANLYNKNTLTKGATYYYVVMNYNRVAEETMDVNLFYSQTTKSSNTKVISATQDGILKAKYPGVAKVTVKPAAGSGLSMSKTLVVLPSKVTGVKLTAKKKAMKVAWKKTAGASGYKVYRATSKKGKYKCVKTASSKTTSFTNKKLKKNKKYYYKVCAFVKSGKKTYNGAYSTVVMKKAK